MKCNAKPDEPVTHAIVEQGDLVSHDLLESHSFEALEDTLFLVLSSGLRTGKDYERTPTDWKYHFRFGLITKSNLQLK